MVERTIDESLMTARESQFLRTEQGSKEKDPCYTKLEKGKAFVLGDTLY